MVPVKEYTMSEELMLPGKEFLLLEAPVGDKREITIHIAMATAIREIRGYISKGVDPDMVSLVTVTVDPQELKAVGIPWSTIAVELIKSG
jgi:hypothetical protein